MKKDDTKPKVFLNNLYAVKTIWEINKKRLIHTVVHTALSYAEWLFYSIVFMRYVIGALENEAGFARIMTFVGICFLGFGLMALYTSYFVSSVIPITSTQINKKLYSLLYAKARNVELRCYEDTEFYDKYTRAMDGAGEKMIGSMECFVRIFIGLIAAASAFYAIYTIDPYAVLFVISPIIGNFVFGRLKNNVWTDRYEDNIKNTRIAQYVNRIMCLADYAKEIRFSNIHELMMHRYAESVEAGWQVAKKYVKKGVFYTWANNFMTFTIVNQSIMFYAAYRAIVSRTIGLAELAIMFSSMSASTNILIGLLNEVTESIKNGMFLKYFRAFMEYKEQIPENQEGIIPDDKVESIEFKNVSFGYKYNESVIKNISFKIEGDKVAALVGHNGAGKSTIIKLLFRLYDPDAGEILVNGINIKKYNLKAYRNLFAAAFQDYRLMAMSIKDNVLMGSKPDDPDKAAEAALKQAGIWDKASSLNQGMDTILTKEFDENGVVLSGGEYQKIIVARAFAKSSSVKVFDEPSSALDPIAEYELYKGIMDQTKGHITIFISHRLSSVKDADIVFMLENGEIIEQGSHAELMKKHGPYSEMYTKQAKNYLAIDDFDCKEEALA